MSKRMKAYTYENVRRYREKARWRELTNEEIDFFVNGYVSGDVTDYQAAALCMAIFYKA